MAEDYKLRWKDLFTLSGYDDYLKRNHMVTSETPTPFHSNNPDLIKVQNRADFLRDYNWCLNLGVIGTATIVGAFIGGVTAQIVCESIDSLVDKLF